MLHSNIIDLGYPGLIQKVRNARYGANFDGVSDYVTRLSAFTGIANSQVALVSFHFRTSNNGTMYLYSSYGDSFYIAMAAGKFVVLGKNVAGTNVLTLTNTNTYDDGNWHHFMLGYSLANSGERHIFIDGVEDTVATLFTLTETIKHVMTVSPHHTLGAWYVAALNKWDGDCANIYINTDETLDTTLTATLRKFVTITGRPAQFGSHGQRVTGNQPVIYNPGDSIRRGLNFGYGGTWT